MRRSFLPLALPLCLTLAFSAIGTSSNPAAAQEEASAENVKASDQETADENPDQEAEKTESAPEPAKDDSADAKSEDVASQKSGDAQPEPSAADDKSKEKSTEAANDPPADASAKKQQGKPTKPEPTEPKKLPKLGASEGPLLPGQPWRVHDRRRPRPAVVTPGEPSTYDKPGTAPSDAIVLFDGKDLSNWCHISSEDPDQLLEPRWKVENGYFEVTPRTGNLHTIDSFGSCQLHIEWQAPEVVRGDSQGRGNSGIHFMEKFEIQVLDSFNNRTYADGQAGAIYGRFPPMVNASRKPGEWQIFDILFEAPKFSLDGELERPATATVMHNGIFLHNARDFHGPSGAGVQKYSVLTPTAPIRLQDHGNPVRFRNVWVRPITPQPGE